MYPLTLPTVAHAQLLAAFIMFREVMDQPQQTAVQFHSLAHVVACVIVQT